MMRPDIAILSNRDRSHRLLMQRKLTGERPFTVALSSRHRRA